MSRARMSGVFAAVYKRKAERGVAAVTFALMLVPMMLMSGLTIDGYSLYVAHQKLQLSVDAAALAAAADNTDLSTDHAQTVAFNYLDSSPYLQNVQVTGRTVVSDTTARTVSVTLDGEVPTYLMKMFNANSMKVSVTAKAERAQPGPMDLVLALDTTSSMSAPPQGGVETKIATLKSAAKALVSQVMASGSSQIQVGIVPYASYLNVGTISPVPTWVNPIDRTITTCSVYDPPCYHSPRYNCIVDGVFKINGCVDNICGTCVKTATTTAGWKGCIGARTLDGSSSGTDAYLAKISSPTNPKYPGLATNIPECRQVGSAILPLTSDLTTVTTLIDTLKVGNNTYIPGGLTWGWNVLAPGEPYDARTLAQLQALGGRKVLVLMTDGINTMSPILPNGFIGYNGSINPTPAWRDGTKTKALIGTLCTNIKADGIEIYTVLFDERDAEMTQIMKDCASEPSKAFTASDRTGLLEAFTEIGDQLKRLRLIK